MTNSFQEERRLKARRNLMVLNFIILFILTSGLKITKLSFVGTEFSIGTQYLNIKLWSWVWIVWLYFLARYWQRLNEMDISDKIHISKNEFSKRFIAKYAGIVFDEIDQKWIKISPFHKMTKSRNFPDASFVKKWYNESDSGTFYPRLVPSDKVDSSFPDYTYEAIISNSNKNLLDYKVRYSDNQRSMIMKKVNQYYWLKIPYFFDFHFPYYLSAITLFLFLILVIFNSSWSILEIR